MAHHDNITASDLVKELERQAGDAHAKYVDAYLNSASRRKIGILRNGWHRAQDAYCDAQRAALYLEQLASKRQRGEFRPVA